MTSEEAIKILKAIRVYDCYPKSASEETKEAIDMAIEALQADAVSLTGTMKYLTKPHNYCEVVRCKDCRHGWYDDDIEYYTCRHPKGLNEELYGVDFCSYGERKE